MTTLSTLYTYSLAGVRRSQRDDRIYTHIPDGTPEDLARGLEDLDQATPDYDVARLYYEGHVDEFFEFAATPAIQRKIEATGQRYRFRMAKTPVNALANRVRIAAITVPGDQAATDEIDRIRAANNMSILEADLIRDTFVDGDGYLVVWPYEDDESTTTDDDLADAGVEVTYNSPVCGRMLYDEEHLGRKIFYIKRWQDTTNRDAPVWRVDLYYPDGRVESWESIDHKPGEALGTWVEADDEDTAPPVEEGGGEVPVFHFRTGSPYGRPEHRDAYGPQDAINKALITQITTMDSHGWPHRYRLLADGAELDSNSDDPDWDDDAAPLTSTQGGKSTSLRHGSGVEDVYNNTKEVGQFAAADLSGFNDPVEMYVRLMAQVTETPPHYFDISGQQPSGIARIRAEAPLDDKADDRKARLAVTFEEMWRYILRLRGVEVDKVAIEWAPPRIVLDKEFWETAKIKSGLGVPMRQILLEAGYLPSQVDEWEQQQPVQVQQRGQETGDDQQDDDADSGDDEEGDGGDR